MVVGIIDDIVEFSRLREEGSNLSVVPTTDNVLSIGKEVDGVTLKSWHLNSEQLLSRRRIPNSDIVQRTGGEDLTESMWES